jgi:hypothetical protein
MRMIANQGRRSQHKGKKSPSRRKSPLNSKLKCTECGGASHVESDCWIKYSEKRPNYEKSEAKSASISFSARAIPKLDGNSNYWYLDSAASEHFTPYKDTIESYKELPRQKEIGLANGVICHGVGKGIVRLTAIARKFESQCMTSTTSQQWMSISCQQQHCTVRAWKCQ